MVKMSDMRKAQGLRLVAAVLLSLSFILGCKSQPPAIAQGPQARTPEEAVSYFTAELVVEDIEAALQGVHPSSQEQINSWLNEIQSSGKMQELLKMLSGRMEAVRIGADIAEYNFFEEGDPEPLTATFMKIDDGWLIAGF